MLLVYFNSTDVPMSNSENMSEKLCLKWNDFKENVLSVFGNLRDDKDFSDVTLAFEDGKQVEAHKVILAGSSPFFENILRRNKHTHPLIYMRGMRSEDLVAVIDFLYCGEANVHQENLDSFLAIADELKLNGFMGQADVDEVTEDVLIKKASQKAVLPIFKTDVIKSSRPSSSKLYEPEGKTVELTNNFSADVKELLEKLNSMMEKTCKKMASGRYIFSCKMCGKEGKSGHIKNHIETNHLEGVSVPCNTCEKTFKSRNSLAKHTCMIPKNNI